MPGVVSDMLADVLITALTEGGKAGSKKLGDYIKKELLSASSMFISSIIRAQLGNFMQSAFGINATNYAGGTLAGNLVGTPPGSLLGSAITGVGNLAGSTGLASFGAGIGLSLGQKLPPQVRLTPLLVWAQLLLRYKLVLC